MKNSLKPMSNKEPVQVSANHNVVTMDIGAAIFDEAIRTYSPPSHLIFFFNNPGALIIGQRPNPDIDPHKCNTTTEEWYWRPQARTIKWDRIRLITPIKEALKKRVFDVISSGAWGTGFRLYQTFLYNQDILKDPNEWPWTYEKVRSIMSAYATERAAFYNFKSFYTASADAEIPGFSKSIAFKIRNLAPIIPGQFTDHATTKHRKHVLTLEEDRLIRMTFSLPSKFPTMPLPTEANNIYSFEDLAGWLGYKEELSSAKEDDTKGNPIPLKRIQGKVKEYLRRYKIQTVDNTRMALIKKGIRASEIIPVVRASQVRHKLLELRGVLMTQIAYALGCRPAQIAGIDERGFMVQEVDGDLYYSIEIPRRKKRDQSKSVKRRKFPSEIGLGQRITDYLNLKREAETLGIITKHDINKGPAPMFFRTVGGRPNFLSNNEHRSTARMTEGGATSVILDYLKNVVKIDRNARDLRRNAGQRLADAGYSAEVIAEVLDHKTTGSIKHYITASLSLSEIQETALGTHEGYQQQMDKLSGRKIIYLRDITSNTDLISGVVSRIMVSGIGACGKNQSGTTPCEAEPVYSCYLDCPAFQPFEDVNTHKTVLAALESEVIQYTDISHDTSEPAKMALTNREVILGVKAVIEYLEKKQT
jgi:hypothetical protein